MDRSHYIEAPEGPQVVASLGPATAGGGAIEALLQAGATGLRVNTSHVHHGDVRALVERAVSEGFDASSIILDLQGGKTRIGLLSQPITLEAGDEILLEPGTEGTTFPSPRGRSVTRIPVDRGELLAALAPGDPLRLDDGRIELQVIGSVSHRVQARVTTGGVLRSRKGITRPGPSLSLPITTADAALLRSAIRDLGVGRFAISYASPGLLREARALAPDATLVAKLETHESTEQLRELASLADELWLCRGDLGAEVGLDRLPGVQRRVLRALPLPVPLLVAGEVLQHTTVAPVPSRSEACHVVELLERGVSGFVLSDETAWGPNGPLAVGWLTRLARETIRGQGVS